MFCALLGHTGECLQDQWSSGLLFIFFWFDALRPGKQFFSPVGTEPSLPGYYQYF